MKTTIYYPAKILLFGEYGIIKDYPALSIPYKVYKGNLKLNLHFNNEPLFLNSNKEIRKYYNFICLEKEKKNKLYFAKCNLEKFFQDIKNGIFFKSNIPIKYGIGSSGALVAAIYDNYFKKHKTHNLVILKKIFSYMESFFHGISSGMDPLICYLNKPLLFSYKEISIMKIPKNNKKGKGAIFLLNSGFPCNTICMINIFIKKFKRLQFQRILKYEFSKYNEKCIEHLLTSDFENLLKNVKKLSIWILHHLQSMIPKNLLKIWKEGIYNNIHYFKLCGSGGGGYMLGFSPNYKLSKKILIQYKYKVKEVLRF